MRLEATNIQFIGNELAIQWNDGQESYFRLEQLRHACPCATVSASPCAWKHRATIMRLHGRQDFELLAWELIGGYALQPRWRDGHTTGLYSFHDLRRLSAPSL